MKNILLRSSALALTSLAFASVLQAATASCDTTTPSDGDTVTCAGNGAGVDFSGINDLTVTVTGEIVETGMSAFQAGDGLVLENSGTIQHGAAGQFIIDAGDGANVTNSGTLTTGGVNAANGLRLGDDSSFIQTSEGTLSGGTGTLLGTVLLMGENAYVENAGTISISGPLPGIWLGDDSTMINSGLVDSVGQSIYVNGSGTVINSGKILSDSSSIGAILATGDLTVVNQEGAVISAESGATMAAMSGALDLTNYGTIEGASSITISGRTVTAYNGATGVISIEVGSGLVGFNGMYLVNDGLIENSGQYYAVQGAGTDSFVVNNGTIRVTNVNSQFGAVWLSGSNATLTNTGLIESDGYWAGVVLGSSGTLNNRGTIRLNNTTRGAGVFAGENTTINNAGLISGFYGIDLRSGDGSAVTNAGMIIGTGGTAIAFGDGDDTLTLQSLDIQGDILFGDGNDTVVVAEGARAGALTFGSDLETVDTSANAAAIYADNTLVVADISFLSGLEMAQARSGLQLSRQITSGFGAGWWGSFNMDLQDSASQGTLTIGRDFDSFGLFVAAARGGVEGDDGLNQAARDSVLAGVRMGHDLGAARLTGAVYAGKGDTTFSDVASGLEFGSVEDTVVGLALGVDATFSGNLGLSARAGVEQHESDAYALSSLGGAAFDARSMTASFVDLEASWAMPVSGGLTARPFVGASLIRIEGDANAMSFGGETVSFDGAAGETLTTVNLGAELSGSEVWTARLETRFDDSGLLGGGVSFGMHF